MENQLGATEYPASPEHQPDSAKVSREIGAKILAQANFESRQKDIVESSFNKAQRQGERLPGKNNERRNYAYLSRLENLVDKYGTEGEKRLWRQSADKLIIKPEDIPDSYWKSQEQILRDNGQGRELSTQEKDLLTNEIINNQKESIASWSNYLGDEHSPYPLWFKVYAFDGVSKMGVFDKDKKQFTKRDSHTVAPFPKLNASVLAKVYNAVSSLYGEPNPTFTDEANPGDDEIKELAKSGSFNKLYSYVLLKEKPIPKTPERTEDVHGEWIEYLPGEEENLAAAAEGTPWCVANPSTGRNYLEYGSYQDHDDDYDDYDDYDDEPNENQAKFILFHLQDSETGTLSPNACASIRLDPDGNVAEISGLNDGQALEDSLVPIVEEKVKSLPGGEKFLEAFADKQELIRLDQKMQNNEDLTKEELEFIYELHRPIKTLDTYNTDDPRIDELRWKYGVEYALNNGVDVNQLVARMGSYDIIENLNTLINHGAKIDIGRLVIGLNLDDIVDNLNTLINHGADIDQLVARMGSDDITRNLDALIDHSAGVNQLVAKMGSYNIARSLDALISHGADINQLVARMGSYDIIENLDTLINHGADVNQLVAKMGSYNIARSLNTLINHGAKIDVNQLVTRMLPDDIARSLDALISHGADINQLVARMDSYDIIENLDTIINHGAEIDINQFAAGLSPFDTTRNLDTLINHGAKIDINQLVARMDPEDIARSLDALISHGANPAIIEQKLGRKLTEEELQHVPKT